MGRNAWEVKCKKVSSYAWRRIYENKGSDYQGQAVSKFRQILLTSSIRNVWRTIRKICIFISAFKGLTIILQAGVEYDVINSIRGL